MMYRKYANVAPHDNKIFKFVKLFISGTIIVGKKVLGKKCFWFQTFGRNTIKKKVKSEISIREKWGKWEKRYLLL